MVCPKCGYYVRLNSQERIALLTDKNSFVEINSRIKPVDILNFPGYKEKKIHIKQKTPYVPEKQK